MEVLYPHCAGLDVHKETVVACARHMVNGTVTREVRTFGTTTKDLLALSEWLASQGCTHVAMEATGVYWKPVWHILSDGDFTLVLANAKHVKNVPGRKTDVNDATWLADLTQTICSRAQQSCPAAAEDAGGCQHRSEEHTSELQSRPHLVCRLLARLLRHRPFLDADQWFAVCAVEDVDPAVATGLGNPLAWLTGDSNRPARWHR